jgi:hypothetical protein
LDARGFQNDSQRVMERDKTQPLKGRLVPNNCAIAKAIA